MSSVKGLLSLCSLRLLGESDKLLEFFLCREKINFWLVSYFCSM